MISEFINILISPINKNKLIYDNYSLKDSINGDIFEIIENVPVLLPKNPSNINAQIHVDSHSEFNYLEHYQADAEMFDYFEEYNFPASIHANRRLREIIIDKVNKESNIILDVGCGMGWVAEYFLPKGNKVISMDISTVNPIKVKKLYASEYHLAITADAFNLPISDESVDTIIASEIIEHIADPKLFIASLLKALKIGGKLIISTPYNEKLAYYLCVHCNKPTPRNAHIHSFNENNFLKYIPVNSKYKIEKTNNFILEKLRTHIILKYLPYKLWRIIDNIVNRIIGRADKLIVEIIK